MRVLTALAARRPLNASIRTLPALSCCPTHCRLGHAPPPPPGRRFGVLSTLSSKAEGFPEGSVVEYVADPQGRPIFSFSTLSSHTSDVQRDGRCSLTVLADGFNVSLPGAVPCMCIPAHPWVQWGAVAIVGTVLLNYSKKGGVSGREPGAWRVPAYQLQCCRASPDPAKEYVTAPPGCRGTHPAFVAGLEQRAPRCARCHPPAMPPPQGMNSARVTLRGVVAPLSSEEQDAARELYLQRHPGSFWVDFGDFSWFRMDQIAGARVVGGFGRAGKVRARVGRPDGQVAGGGCCALVSGKSVGLVGAWGWWQCTRFSSGADA